MRTPWTSALALAAACVMPFAAHAQTAEPIKIGAVLSTTGPVGFIGDPQQKVLELHVKRLNDAGGLLGRQVKLIVYDDQSDANNANTFAKRLIDSDKVDAMIGGTVSPSALAMIPHAERSGVPFVSTGGSAAIVEPVKKWVFKTPPTDRMVAERILLDMKAHGITRIGLLSDTSGFGQSGKKEVDASAGANGITVVVQETFGPKDTDVTPQLTKIRNAVNLQAVLVFTGAGSSPALAAKNYAQIGLKLPLYMPHAAVNQELIKLAGAAAEGIRMPTAPFVVPDVMADADPQKAVAQLYYSSYKEAFKADASPFGANAYDALILITDAIKRAGSTDKAKVRDALEQSKNVVGLNGVFSMTAANHNGLTPDALRMVEVQGGKFVAAK
ncbi:MAG: amino acid/amide transporter substrate-binding protein family [Rhizobacter sp.]|nr:amino acid/amide transporter substrate-binding protein family [Rhizobacter sp.]